MTEGFVIDKYDQQQIDNLAYALVEAMQHAMNVDQLMYEDVRAAVEPIIRMLKTSPVRCVYCRKEMDYIEWGLGQGTCPDCITKIMAAEDRR